MEETVAAAAACVARQQAPVAAEWAGAELMVAWQGAGRWAAAVRVGDGNGGGAREAVELVGAQKEALRVVSAAHTAWCRAPGAAQTGVAGQVGGGAGGGGDVGGG